MEILAPPVLPLTKVQEEYESLVLLLSFGQRLVRDGDEGGEGGEQVKHYKALNKGGFLTKHQEMDVRDLAAYSTFVTGVWIS